MSSVEETLPPIDPASVPGIFLSPSFRLQAADKNLVQDTQVFQRQQTAPRPTQTPSTGTASGPRPDSKFVNALAFLSGPWSGPGYNQIFRPRSKNLEKLPNDMFPDDKLPDSENVLELNLTHEIWNFSKPLGDIPNRGFGNQRHLTLQGRSYTQTVLDVTDSTGGRLNIDRAGNLLDQAGHPIQKTAANDRPRDIHFETGMFLNVPSLNHPTTNHPTKAEEMPRMCRMASIPHGTTINLQDFMSSDPGKGEDEIRPRITLGRITPFNASEILTSDGSPVNGQRTVKMGGQDAKEDDPNWNAQLRTASQNAKDKNTARLPQDLEPHKDHISQELLDDANRMLTEHNEHKTITKNIVFRLNSTTPKSQYSRLREAVEALQSAAAALKTAELATVTEASISSLGRLLDTAGNISNIAFLDGALGQAPSQVNSNSSVIHVHSVFWISRVEYKVKLNEDWHPATAGDGTPLVKRITPDSSEDGQQYAKGTVPTFAFPHDQPIKAQTVVLPALQLQYTQTVLLRFKDMAWPHISVGTVVPMADVQLIREGDTFTTEAQKRWELYVEQIDGTDLDARGVIPPDLVQV